MDRILRFPGTLRRSPDVEAWMRRQPRELGKIARRWFAVMRACGDDVREILHDGHPTACIGDAAFAYVNAFRAHVNVGFFRGAELADPQGLVEGSGRFMRHVKIRPGGEPDARALRELIAAAHADMRGRLEDPTTTPATAGWTCPECGRRFRFRTREHSCDVRSLASHLARSEPEVQAAFQALRKAVARLGPHEIVPVKTMVIFRAGSNFGGVIFGRRHLDVSFFLPERLSHPRVTRIERLSPRRFAHRVRVTQAGEVDAELRHWLARARRA